jgi:hypothetical protein
MWVVNHVIATGLTPICGTVWCNLWKIICCLIYLERRSYDKGVILLHPSTNSDENDRAQTLLAGIDWVLD